MDVTGVMDKRHHRQSPVRTRTADPGSVAALADRVSGPVAAAAAVVVGVLLLLILVLWLARKVVHKIIGIAVSVAAAAATHTGTQTWIHHLISTATHS